MRHDALAPFHRQRLWKVRVSAIRSSARLARPRSDIRPRHNAARRKCAVRHQTPFCTAFRPAAPCAHKWQLRAWRWLNTCSIPHSAPRALLKGRGSESLTGCVCQRLAARLSLFARCDLDSHAQYRRQEMSLLYRCVRNTWCGRQTKNLIFKTKKFNFLKS